MINKTNNLSAIINNNERVIIIVDNDMNGLGDLLESLAYRIKYTTDEKIVIYRINETLAHNYLSDLFFNIKELPVMVLYKHGEIYDYLQGFKYYKQLPKFN